MMSARFTTVKESIHEMASPLTGTPVDYDPLLKAIGNARFILLGEASHGTHEFYQVRAEITQRLITEKQVTAVAVEADWPDAARVNRYVQDHDGDATAEQALAGFQRFPIWMWRNQDVLAFLRWLHAYNSESGATRKVGFYGLDLYSLSRSMEAVIRYLEQVDPDAAQRARARYSCFEQFGEDGEEYSYATGLQLSPSCEQEVINQLLDLQQQAKISRRRDGQQVEDAWFSAEQNARLVKNAEHYYRTMFSDKSQIAYQLAEPRLERAIGVIYRPESERISHYFTATLPAQFDAIIHLDETCAVEPLDRTERWEQGEPPETYLTAL